MLLDLPIRGQVVTGPPNLQWDTCFQLVGIEIPADERDVNTLSLKWLGGNLISNDLNEHSPLEARIQHTRRYLRWLIGELLFPNTTRLFVHNSWLYLLMDFYQTRTYSRGSSVLTFLYRGMCEASHPDKKALAGCNFLLQVLGYCRLSYIASKNENLL